MEQIDPRSAAGGPVDSDIGMCMHGRAVRVVTVLSRDNQVSPSPCFRGLKTSHQEEERLCVSLSSSSGPTESGPGCRIYDQTKEHSLGFFAPHFFLVSAAFTVL